MQRPQAWLRLTLQRASSRVRDVGGSPSGSAVAQRAAYLRGPATSAAALAVALLCSAAPGLAQSTPDEDLGSPLEVHGFVSQGYIKSARNEYLAKSKGRGSFEFAELGLNFTKQLSDDLRLGVQLFAHDLGPLGGYTPEADWFYLDYQWQDWLGIRVGRTKMPFGLYNEVNDIDVARVPILLPQSIYPVDHREFLFAQTGGELYGSLRLGPVGELEYRAYYGTLFAENPPPPAAGITVTDIHVPYVFGGRVTWGTPLPGLRLGGSAQQLRFDWRYNINPDVLAVLQALQLLPLDVGSPLPVQFQVTRWVGSLEFAFEGLELSAEYSRWIGEFRSRAPALLPPHTVNERYYAMLSYHLFTWFTPGAYFSAYYPNVDDRRGREAHQHDLALTARYDLTSHWLLKLEGHLMRGTAGLDNPRLNDGVQAKDLAKDWGVFLVKTTAYF
jgi:hypothetical protein